MQLNYVISPKLSDVEDKQLVIVWIISGFIRDNSVGIILNTTMLGSQFLTFYPAVASASVSHSALFWGKKT